MEDHPDIPHVFKDHVYKGIRWPNVILDSSIDAMQTFEVRPDDIWVVTYPKSGTHWMAEIVGLILADGIPENIDRTLYSSTITMIDMQQDLKSLMTKEDKEKPPVSMTPFLEKVEKARSPRMLMTHLPLNLLPPNVEKRSKVLYVARNPKDVVNSYYNFVGKNLFSRFITWERVFEEFIKDEPVWGPWFEHVIDFWKLRSEENIFFLFYEELKKDPAKFVRQIAEFMRRPLSEEALQRVVEHSSFKGMKQTYDKVSKTEKGNFAKGGGVVSFMSKGTVAQWKHRFTVAQNEAFDKWYADKMTGTDLKFDFY